MRRTTWKYAFSHAYACRQLRYRSACASMQSDQGIHHMLTVILYGSIAADKAFFLNRFFFFFLISAWKHMLWVFICFHREIRKIFTWYPLVWRYAADYVKVWKRPISDYVASLATLWIITVCMSRRYFFLW